MDVVGESVHLSTAQVELLKRLFLNVLSKHLPKP